MKERETGAERERQTDIVGIENNERIRKLLNTLDLTLARLKFGY